LDLAEVRILHLPILRGKIHICNFFC